MNRFYFRNLEKALIESIQIYTRKMYSYLVIPQTNIWLHFPKIHNWQFQNDYVKDWIQYTIPMDTIYHTFDPEILERLST